MIVQCQRCKRKYGPYPNMAPVACPACGGFLNDISDDEE